RSGAAGEGAREDCERLKQRQDSSFGVIAHRIDCIITITKQFFQILRRAVPAPHPNDFRWEAPEKAKLAEVDIFRDDHAVLLSSVLPDLDIKGGTQTNR